MAAQKITAAEAAARLGINLRTLWRWRDAGRLKEAGRAGRTVLFDAAEVDELRGVRRPSMGAADLYRRLTEAEEWADIERLRDELAAQAAAEAEDRGPIEAAWRAACGMAATHPDEDARERWRVKAERYGAWLGMRAEETEAAIRGRGREGSYCTYESARAEAEAAPADPILALTALTIEYGAPYVR